MGGEPTLSFEQPVINEDIQPLPDVAPPEAAAASLLDPVADFLEKHGNEFTRNHNGELVTYYQAVEDCPALPMMIRALGEGALTLTAAIHESGSPEGQQEEAEEPEEPGEEPAPEASEPESGDSRAGEHKDDGASAEKAAVEPEADAAQMVQAAAETISPASTPEGARPNAATSEGAIVTAAEGNSSGGNTFAEAPAAKSEPRPVAEKQENPMSDVKEPASASQPAESKAAPNQEKPAERPAETPLPARSAESAVDTSPLQATEVEMRNQPRDEAVAEAEVDSVKDIIEDVEASKNEPALEPDELTGEQDAIDVESGDNEPLPAAADGESADIEVDELALENEDGDEEVLVVDQAAETELDDEDELQLVADELLAEPAELGDELAATAAEFSATEAEPSAEMEPVVAEETERAVLELADIIAEIDGDEADEAQQLMDKIAQKIMEMQAEELSGGADAAEAPEPEIGIGTPEADPDTKELEELFIELFERVGMEYTPELAESLTKLVLRQDIANVIPELAKTKENDSSQDRGTHEIINRLLVAAATMKKILAHACGIGKSALRLYARLAPQPAL